MDDAGTWATPTGRACARHFTADTRADLDKAVVSFRAREYDDATHWLRSACTPILKNFAAARSMRDIETVLDTLMLFLMFVGDNKTLRCARLPVTVETLENMARRTTPAWTPDAKKRLDYVLCQWG